MATTSSRLSNTRRTLSGPLKRHLVTAGSATFAMLSRLPAEYSRAAAAAQRYDELKGSGLLTSRPIGAGSIPRTIFDEFYSGRTATGWRPWVKTHVLSR